MAAFPVATPDACLQAQDPGAHLGMQALLRSHSVRFMLGMQQGFPGCTLAVHACRQVLDQQRG